MPYWSNFLKRIAGHTQITLIGPQPHSAPIFKNPTIFIDGGHASRPSGPEGPEIAVSVGDGDSWPGGGLDQILPTAKDHSDLAFVLRSLPPHVQRISLHGFMGGRLDHELANLGEVFAFLKSRSTGRCDFYKSEGDLGMTAWSGLALTLSIQGLFSVFTFDGGPIQIQGAVRYPLDPPQSLPPLSSHGLSNEGHGEVRISSHGPSLLVLNISR